MYDYEHEPTEDEWRDWQDDCYEQQQSDERMAAELAALYCPRCGRRLWITGDRRICTNCRTQWVGGVEQPYRDGPMTQEEYDRAAERRLDAGLYGPYDDDSAAYALGWGLQ